MFDARPWTVGDRFLLLAPGRDHRAVAYVRVGVILGVLRYLAANTDLTFVQAQLDSPLPGETKAERDVFLDPPEVELRTTQSYYSLPFKEFLLVTVI